MNSTPLLVSTCLILCNTELQVQAAEEVTGDTSGGNQSQSQSAELNE